jgi:electron transport complex protein RnfD
MALVIGSSPDLTPQTTVTSVMLKVCCALIPGIVAYVWFFGWGVLFNIIIGVATAVGTEVIMLKLRHRPVRPFITDGSALVTGLLLAVAIPPLSPWWLIVVGTMFAMIFGKHLFGGLGYNPFNPAMLGYAVLLIAFPLEMTHWSLPHMLNSYPLGAVESLTFLLTGNLPAGVTLDSVTSATVLDTIKTQQSLNFTLGEITSAGIFGSLGGKGWEWINLGYLIGGLWLLYVRVISWQIPVAVLGGLFFIALLFNIIDPDTYPSAIFHCASGAAILGAFFIATDPVSASTTNTGRLIYGAGIGVLTYIIRTWGGYPDGIAFAVLLMNMMTPTIDYYTRPRVFGQEE